MLIMRFFSCSNFYLSLWMLCCGFSLKIIYSLLFVCWWRRREQIRILLITCSKPLCTPPPRSASLASRSCCSSTARYVHTYIFQLSHTYVQRTSFKLRQSLNSYDDMIIIRKWCATWKLAITIKIHFNHTCLGGHEQTRLPQAHRAGTRGIEKLHRSGAADSWGHLRSKTAQEDGIWQKCCHEQK